MFIQKKKLCRAVLIICLIVITGITVLFALRSDWRFIASQQIKALTESAQLTQIEESSLVISNVHSDENELKKYTLDQSLMLVNQQNVLNSDFDAQIQEYLDSGADINSCAADAFGKLSAAVKENTGEKLYILSSFRTAEEQKSLIDEQGSDTAMPSGSSEHQTGLALDVCTDGFAGMGFLKSDAGKFVNSKCYEYGFIIRYPFMKKSVTGIDYEPWHIRYVGFPHSEIITFEHQTLEEYIESLEYGNFYFYDDYIITRQQGENLKIPSGESTVISPDNCGGYVITVKAAEIK